MEEHAREIERVIRQLQESGEYERFAQAGSDPEGERLLKAWAMREELTDEDVDWLTTHSREVPVPSPSELEREVAQMLARAQAEAAVSPLARLRMERGRTSEELADVLGAKLEVDASKRGKLRRYYRALEAGVFDATQVSRRLIAALAELLQADESVVMAPAAVQSIGFMAPPESVLMAAREARQAILPLPARGSAEWDEIDDLFREES